MNSGKAELVAKNQTTGDGLSLRQGQRVVKVF